MTQFHGELTFGRTQLSFDVPAGVHSVSVTGTTVTKGFLYAAVYDANQGFRGKVLFEKTHKSLHIQKQDSGLGAIDGDLPHGRWTVELYNLEGEFRSERSMQYHVDFTFDEETKVSQLPLTQVANTNHQLTFDYSKILNSESRWYRGDLHAHTQLSDGHNTLEAAKNIVESQGLDFFFFTEHNICQPKLPQSEKCLFLPGIEVTTDLGHFNVHGAARSLDLRQVTHTSAAVIEAGLALADSGQSAIAINHPMMKPWHWHYDAIQLSQISTFEVYCDPTWSTSAKAADEAIKVLNEMWNCGHRITAIGGSDSHLEPHERNPKATEPSIYGDPSTFVFSHGLSGEGIISGLRNSHVYLERQCGLSFQINHGSIIPGQDTQGSALTYELSVLDDSLDYIAEVVMNGEVQSRIVLSQQFQTLEIPEGYKWCRIDIRRQHNNEFEGCINPVFDASQSIFKTPLVDTWGELMERLNSDEI
ncbi:TPA: CehA/McbA family metallohydrolase [Vibrio vulnificus]|uniref:CehA/McbA family metallohydrolase n=1 Tax=Vibrio vulnificus TaxID=672 RepID=UPI000CD1695A|nr:CehA/McbA family metallohydrolase [Vibrio vulnificus]POB16372.1 hypothetical protein CRN36_19985 [Vibrio vulnificus]HDY7989928.1 PHP domain-containing protein [Vibrio vulnificus]HDY8019134.1 PHP domain-containing protein [Vibrio vulnificus]HDY8040279.1 PHP domain-containing protein [Vibrio vulnificus]